MNLQNQNWIAQSTETSGTIAPTRSLLSAGSPGLRPSAEQDAFVRQAYQQFCTQVRLSTFPNGYHTATRTGADGTVVRMESNAGVHRVFVSIPGAPGGEKEIRLPSGIGICLVGLDDEPLENLRIEVEPGVFEPQPLLLQPGLKKIPDPDDSQKQLYRSSGTWKVKKIDRITGSKKLWVSSDRKNYYGVIGEQRVNNTYGSWQIPQQAQAYGGYMKFKPEWLAIDQGQAKETPGGGFVNESRYANAHNDTFSIVPPKTGVFTFYSVPPFLAKLPTGTAVYYITRGVSGGVDLYKSSVRPKTGLWVEETSKQIEGLWESVGVFSPPPGKLYYYDTFQVRSDGRQILVRAYESGVSAGYATIELTDEGELVSSYEDILSGEIEPLVRKHTFALSTSVVDQFIPVARTYTGTGCNNETVVVSYQEPTRETVVTELDTKTYDQSNFDRLHNVRLWDRDDKIVDEYREIRNTISKNTEISRVRTSTSKVNYIPPVGDTTAAWTTDVTDKRIVDDTIQTYQETREEWFVYGDRRTPHRLRSYDVTLEYTSDRTRLTSSDPYVGPQACKVLSRTKHHDDEIILHLPKAGITFVFRVHIESLIDHTVDLVATTTADVSLPITSIVNEAWIVAIDKEGNEVFTQILDPKPDLKTNHSVERSSLLFDTLYSPNQFNSRPGYQEEAPQSATYTFQTVSPSGGTCPVGSPRPSQPLVGNASINVATPGDVSYTTPAGETESPTQYTSLALAPSPKFTPYGNSTLEPDFMATDNLEADFAEDPTTGAYVVGLRLAPEKTQSSVEPFSLVLAVDEDETGTQRVRKIQEVIDGLPEELMLWQKHMGNSLMSI